MNFGGPVWHASGRGRDVLTSRWLAMRALEGCGASPIGQWVEDRRPGGVVHVRRRLTPAEASHVNELRDIRGTAEERDRLAAIACVVPSQLHPFYLGEATRMRQPIPTITPMKLRRFATLWECEGEVVIDPDSPRQKLLYEPLLTLAPEDAEPYCCYACTVVFYERGTRKEITRVDHYNLAAAPSPHLLRVYDRWYEASPRRVVWRAGTWYMTYTLDDRTRAARFANLGSACLHQWDEEELQKAVDARRARKLAEKLNPCDIPSHHSASGR